MLRILPTIISCVTFAASGDVAAAQKCDAILSGGVFNEEKIKSNEEFKREFVDLLCNSSESASSKSKKIGVSIPIVDSLLGLKGQIDGGGFNKAKSCADKTSRSEDQITKDIHKKFADQNLLNTFLACSSIYINSEATGLLCRIDNDDSDPEQAKILINWKPTNIGQEVELDANAINLNCQGFLTPTFRLKPFDSRAYLCTRPDVYKSSKIVINSNAAGSRCDLYVEAVPRPIKADPIMNCFDNIKSKYPGGVANNTRAIAGQRCCQQMLIFKQDLAMASLAEKQWQNCTDMLNRGDKELARICVEANTVPGFKANTNWQVIAQKGLNDATQRRTQLESMQVGESGGAMCLSE